MFKPRNPISYDRFQVGDIVTANGDDLFCVRIISEQEYREKKDEPIPTWKELRRYHGRYNSRHGFVCVDASSYPVEPFYSIMPVAWITRKVDPVDHLEEIERRYNDTKDFLKRFADSSS